jgi:hypothetical protein
MIYYDYFVIIVQINQTLSRGVQFRFFSKTQIVPTKNTFLFQQIFNYDGITIQ